MLTKQCLERKIKILSENDGVTLTYVKASIHLHLEKTILMSGNSIEFGEEMRVLVF